MITRFSIKFSDNIIFNLVITKMFQKILVIFIYIMFYNDEL